MLKSLESKSLAKGSVKGIDEPISSTGSNCMSTLAHQVNTNVEIILMRPRLIERPAPTGVPELPIKYFVRGYSNRAQMCPRLSAIDVTEKTFFERLY